MNTYNPKKVIKGGAPITTKNGNRGAKKKSITSKPLLPAGVKFSGRKKK